MDLFSASLLKLQLQSSSNLRAPNQCHGNGNSGKDEHAGLSPQCKVQSQNHVPLIQHHGWHHGSESLLKICKAIFGCMSSMCENTSSDCYNILNSSRFFNFKNIWCHQILNAANSPLEDSYQTEKKTGQHKVYVCRIFPNQKRLVGLVEMNHPEFGSH